MSRIEALYELLKQNMHRYDLIQKIRMGPDNDCIIVDCSYAKSATVHVKDAFIYVDSDAYCKVQLETIINELLDERRYLKNGNLI